MASVPLFIPDRDSLLSQLRLGNSSQDDTLAVIDRAIDEVRLGFYDKLGIARVTKLLSYSSVSSPTSQETLLRKRAEIVESQWTQLILLDHLTAQFLDSGSATRQDWNELGLIRNKSRSEIDRMKESLLTRVSEGLASLESGESDDESIKITTIGPQNTPSRPGSSLLDLPYSRRSDIG